MKGAAKLPYAPVRYPATVQTDEEMGTAWQSLRNEMEISQFCKRVGLRRDEVGTVVHGPSGKAFVQWKHAIPDALSTREV